MMRKRVSPNSRIFDKMKRDDHKVIDGVEIGLTKHTLWMKPPLASSFSSAEGANCTNATTLNTAKDVFHMISGIFNLMGSFMSIYCFERNTSSR